VIVQGGSEVGTKSSRIESDQLVLIADKESYEPGDTANIFVQSQYDTKAEGLLTVICTGNLLQQRFELTDGSCILKVPITKEMIPMSKVEVDLVSSNYRLDKFLNPLKDAPKKPAYASGSVSLSVPPLVNELSVEVKPKNSVCLPGSENEVNVVVKNKKNEAVNGSELTLVVVDEAVLSLTGYSIQNPLSFFYPSHSQNFQRGSSRSMVFVKDWSSIQFEEPPEESIYSSEEDADMDDDDECDFMEEKMMFGSAVVFKDEKKSRSRKKRKT